MMIDAFSGGGAERFAVALAASVNDHQFRVTLCSTRGDAWPDEVAMLREHGVETLLLQRRRTWSPGAWLRLVRELRRGRFDVLHAHKHGSNLWGTIVGTLARTPVVLATEHSWSFEGRPLRRLVDRHLVGRFCFAFVAVSSADAARLHTVVGVPAGKIRLIPTGLVPLRGQGRGAGRGLREVLGVEPGTPTLATVSALRPEKALHVVIDAFARVAVGEPAAHLAVIGDGEERHRLEVQVAARGLSSRVHFLGHRDDARALLREVDVMCISSDFEGAPLALIEAMDAGCGIVATEVGGIPEIAPHGTAALLVPRRDPDALASGILELLRAPERRLALGDAARRRVASGYAFDRVTRDWQALYTESLGR